MWNIFSVKSILMEANKASLRLPQELSLQLARQCLIELPSLHMHLMYYNAVDVFTVHSQTTVLKVV